MNYEQIRESDVGTKIYIFKEANNGRLHSLTQRINKFSKAVYQG